MKRYDYILVGAGLYSGVVAYLAGRKGKNCLVLEKRDHLGEYQYYDMDKVIARAMEVFGRR